MSKKAKRFAGQALLVLALPFLVLIVAQILRSTGDFQGQPRALVLVPDPSRSEQLAALADGHWHFVQVATDTRCDEMCAQQLRRMHLWHVALGRRSAQVGALYLHSDPLSEQQRETLHQLMPALRFARVSPAFFQQWYGAGLPSGSRLLSPAGYLVAVLPDSADAGDINKDLRRLIR